MRRVIIISVLGLLLTLTGCPGNQEGSFSGEVTISSELFGTSSYYVTGFRFSDEKFIDFPGSVDYPDIVADNFRGLTEGIIAVGFSSPGNNSAFLLAGAYDSEVAAKEAFSLLTVADTVSTYKEISDTLRNNQVWLFKTLDGHYAKLRIIDVSPAIGLDNTPHYDVQISYRYQPEDSPLLGE